MAGRSRSNGERFLATILFTDIVGSTDLAASLGDDNWRKLIAAHHAAVRKELKQFGGRELDTAGDGFFASFEQPAQAVRAADAILNAAAPLGLGLRAGVHVGEAERVGAKVGGIAVHLASRIMAQAGAGEVIVSSTVRDLVAGSGLEFLDRGVHELRGIPGEWHLYGLVRTDQVPVAPIDARSVAALAADVRSRRTRRLAAIAAVVSLLVIGGVAVFVATRGAKAVVATAPDTLLTIDASSGQPVEVRHVPAGPVSIALDGNDVWVASLDAGVLTSMPLSGSGSASDNRTVGRVGQPTALAAGGSVIWSADAYDEQLSLIDPATGNAEYVLNSLPARSIAYGFGSAWTTDDIHDNVARIDSQTGQVATSITLPAGSFPTEVALGAGSVWVLNSGTSTVSRIDPQTNAVVAGAIPLRYVPSAAAASDNDVWITSRDADQLMRIDPATNTVAATVDVCDQPSAVAADGATVWVACAGAGEVWHLDHDGKQLGTIDAGGLPTDLLVNGDRVYVTVRQ